MRKLLFLLLLAVTLGSCGSTGAGSKFNLFTLDDDRKLGAQVAAEVESDSSGYKMLDSAKYAAVYQYVYKVRNNILNSGQVEHKNDFSWRVRIIHDDSTLNAFCTPGGYIYVFTGLLKYLDSEDQLAGVLGHEMAHADKRHSTRQMTEMFGVQLLLEIIAGNRTAVKQITAGLVGLKFSRNHETEADLNSVKYLCPTVYNAAGGAGFFKKIQAEGGTKVPEFLSTHPDPGNRIQTFESNKTSLGCTSNGTFTSEYNQMKSLLPKK